MDILPTAPEEYEPLQADEEWDTNLEGVLFVTDVPGVTSKEDQPHATPTLRFLTLEMLDRVYNASRPIAEFVGNRQQWSRVFITDESRFCLQFNDGKRGLAQAR
nr:hypothetical protein BaRGS_027083 [Batillaria attramentaria]